MDDQAIIDLNGRNFSILLNCVEFTQLELVLELTEILQAYP